MLLRYALSLRKLRRKRPSGVYSFEFDTMQVPCNFSLLVDNAPFRGEGYFFSTLSETSSQEVNPSTLAHKHPFDYKKGINGSLVNFKDITKLPSEEFEALYQLFALYFQTS